MSIGKSLLYAAGIMIVSVVALIATRGMPTLEQALVGGGTMFLVAFLMMRLPGSDDRRQE